MLIRSFWAKGYRSLCDVKIENLGPFNVFYGPNGAGKSNVLSAMRTLFRLLGLAPGLSFGESNSRWRLPSDGPVQADDRCNLVRGPELTLGTTVEWNENDTDRLDLGSSRLSPLTVELRVEWQGLFVEISRLETQEFDLLKSEPLPGRGVDRVTEREFKARELGTSFDRTKAVRDVLGLSDCKDDPEYRRTLDRAVHDISQHAMTLVDASRSAVPETLSQPMRDLDWLLTHGRLKEAFYRADHHPDGVIRKRYKQLQELLQGPPLKRPPFAIIVDPGSGKIDLRERVPDSPYEVAEVPLDLAGLGVVQVYGIIGSIMLQPARAVGIEEPEAHLHAPTTGKDLRVLLERLVKEGYIDQLFIATHSNLFDLDPTGYFDVSREEGKGTIVVREKDLTKIDKDHLYEPGPAKHALQRSLEYLDDDEVVFRRNDTDEPVTAKQMIEMLQRDDTVAFEFLDDVHEAAVRAVRVKSKRGAPAK